MATLNENTSKIQALIQDISNLPKDRYDEGYWDGHVEGYSEGAESGYNRGKGETTQIMNSIIDRTITELDYTEENLGRNSFAYCTQLTKVKAPFATVIGNAAFYGCASLKAFDVGNPSAKSLFVSLSAFGAASSLKLLVLRSNVIATLQGTGAFTGTPFEQGNGMFLVPRALYDQYIIATNWSTYDNQIYCIEDYTIDGTVSGEINYNELTG